MTYCCCVAGDVTITLSGNQGGSIGGGLVGNCQGYTSFTARFYVGTVYEATFTWVGQTFQVSRSGVDVTVINSANPSCNEKATCIQGACLGGREMLLFFSLSSFVLFF